MTPARWARIQDIIGAALEAPDKEREAYVRSACAGDSGLRADIERLLRESDRSSLASPGAELLESIAVPPVLPGQTVNGYVVLNRLAEGGMGLVYEAIDTRLDRHVALKFLHAELELDESSRTALRNEARAASALDHPNIGTVFGIEETEGGRPFIIMACYDGETLAQRLRRGPLPVKEAAAIAVQAAAGLAEAHAHRIVHRDIKPSNLFLTRQGLVKILDFGIARVIRSATSTRSSGISGTASYMSPEQVQGKFLDARTDLWSLGAVLYEMIAGRRAFPAADIPSALYAIVNSPPAELDQGTPAEARRVIYRALAKRPEDRYQSAAEMIRDLRAVTGPEGREYDPTLTEDELSGYRRLAAGGSWRRLLRRRWMLALPLLAALAALPPLFLRGPKPAAYQSYLDAKRNIYRYDQPGNLERAITLLRGAVAADPRFELGFSSLAEAYWLKWRMTKNTGFLADAESNARRALGLNDSTAEVHIALGQVHSAAGNPDLAMEEFHRALKLDPSNADALIGMGGQYSARLRWQEAEESYRKAAYSRPESWWGYNEFGLFLKQRKRPAEAVQLFRKAIEVTPDNPIPYVNLSGVFIENGNLDEAETILRQAIQRGPPYYPVYGNLGALYSRRREFGKAAEATRQALRLNSLDWRAWTNLGSLYRWLGENRRAVEAYRGGLPLLEQAVKTNSQNAILQARLAEVYAHTGQRDKAESRIRASLALAPHDAPVLQICADAYAVMGDRKLAVITANEAVAKGLTLEELDRDAEARLYRSDYRFKAPRR